MAMQGRTAVSGPRPRGRAHREHWGEENMPLTHYVRESSLLRAELAGASSGRRAVLGMPKAAWSYFLVFVLAAGPTDAWIQ